MQLENFESLPIGTVEVEVKLDIVHERTLPRCSWYTDMSDLWVSRLICIFQVWTAVRDSSHTDIIDVLAAHSLLLSTNENLCVRLKVTNVVVPMFVPKWLDRTVIRTSNECICPFIVDASNKTIYIMWWDLKERSVFGTVFRLKGNEILISFWGLHFKSFYVYTSKVF